MTNAQILWDGFCPADEYEQILPLPKIIPYSRITRHPKCVTVEISSVSSNNGCSVQLLPTKWIPIALRTLAVSCERVCEWRTNRLQTTERCIMYWKCWCNFEVFYVIVLLVKIFLLWKLSNRCRVRYILSIGFTISSTNKHLEVSDN